ncbi:3-oxoacyl-[acyl-carrier-protein] reductase [Wickerhamomyces ciferrii]|uniref:3-oxoacyl-[acyl-carrier-protein] reductase n=1 Tax=Wickerhamomyces ciferrii (strain ATCC 14091 / BCRC 22168 / CBS 111 / JCM 3599 / NBRC 0793 / NRRL Y-1031 F-60-10) TaxID=1206466 RepID=K0KXF8_WICCF|nr:3-oxoacyl-[acyl-carrier-protein] reductase [Wickerhamomyces ciferrii]CCH46164.1 3-oxoacyl-[acyl-carrier-protein] reductase [Wickerhamomyces ciferrii]
MGKTYFVTGVNRGIGFEIVKQYLELDSTNVVIGTVRDPSKAIELQELSKKHKGQLHIIQLEISDPNSIKSIDDQIESIVGETGIDVYIANAGYSGKGSSKAILELERQIWINHYIVNVLGPIEVLKQIKPYLLLNPTRQIILVSSIAGSLSQNNSISSGPYGQNKASLNHVSITLSHELSPDGFTVVAIHPGLVDTDSCKAILDEFVEYKPELKQVLETLPLDHISPETSVKNLIKNVFEPLKKEQNGKFLNYDGTELPW